MAVHLIRGRSATPDYQKPFIDQSTVKEMCLTNLQIMKHFPVNISRTVSLHISIPILTKKYFAIINFLCVPCDDCGHDI